MQVQEQTYLQLREQEQVQVQLQLQGQEQVQVQVQVKGHVQVQYLLVLFLNVLDLPFVLLQLVPRLLQVPPQLGLESLCTIDY